MTTWEEWKASREKKRNILERAGLLAPSRKKISYNPADRAMRKAFGGQRIPDKNGGTLKSDN